MIDTDVPLTIRAKLMLSLRYHQRKRHGRQIGNSRISSSMAQMHDAGQVHATWGIPADKRIPEGSYL